APPIIPVFPGLDIEAWFGELVWLWRWSNLRFIGFYLAHDRSNNQTTWTDHWHDLQDVGWGLVPFYLPFADTEIAQMAAADGAAHGRHAVANARRARLERGAAIYLDIETQVLGEANDAGFMRYINNWFAAVRAGGYTPGTYCSNLDASRILGPDFRDSRPVLFPFSIPRPTRAVWDDANHQLTPPLPATWDVLRDPAWAGNANTIGSQYDWFNSKRDRKGFHWATAAGGAGALRNADWDVAKVWDPSHPRAAATLAIAADRDVRHAHRVFTVKTDRIELRERATMAPIPATARNLELGPADIGPVPRATESGYDAASAAACSRRGGCTDLFLQGQDGIFRTIWTTDRETFPRHGWPLHPEPARRGSPIAAVSRELDQIDVFYISRQHQLVTQWWHPSAADWRRNKRVIAGPLVAGGSNLAVVGRGASGSPPSQLDVFYVSLDYSRPYAAPAKWNDAWQVVHASWAQATDWAVRPIRDLVQPAAASGLAAARDAWGRLDLVVQTRDRRELKHATLDPASGAWTVAAGPGPLPADGDRPMWWMSFGLAVFERVLLLVGVTSSGALAWATHTPGVWSRVELDAAPFTPGRPLALAHRGGGYLDVVGLTEDGDFETRTLEILRGGRVILLPVR
ncbi:MAG TPA: glycoside hydrolase domain-containing protein, partial [Vicinamibacterales bacterium]|nr:glycoside hydrolase domain-containing protein [Vicinamibacterales bacterium]